MTYSKGRPDASHLRKEAGAYVKKLREAADLTQQQVSKGLGLDYYTMISQIELGKTRVPPDRVEQLAAILGVDPVAFQKRLLQYYDPYAWKILFGRKDESSS